MRVLFLLVTMLLLSSCSTDEDSGKKIVNGVEKTLNIGPEGGCFYVNDNGNKSYVDRSDCSC